VENDWPSSKSQNDEGRILLLFQEDLDRKLNRAFANMLIGLGSTRKLCSKVCLDFIGSCPRVSTTFAPVLLAVDARAETLAAVTSPAGLVALVLAAFGVADGYGYIGSLLAQGRPGF